jgi:hypothetical protein
VPQRERYHPLDYGDRQWSRLLTFALERADSFECAIPYLYVVQDLARAPFWPTSLNSLRHDLIERYVSFVRWERNREYPTQFARFRLTPRVAQYVRALGSLDNWLWEHDAPEDPTFYAGDAVLLTADSVDGRIAVYVDDTDILRLANSGVRLIEPLGVTAEPWPTP